ncbi:MAG: VanZ family protein [Myxococcaceae bacterium]|nr:VanZ family protein [Myxococcaceae bacterium]
MEPAASMTQVPRVTRLARVALPLVLVAIYATLAGARVVTNALRDANLLRLSVAGCFVVTAVGVLAAFVRSPVLRRPRALLALGFIAAAYGAVVTPMDSPEEKLHFLEYGVVALLAYAAAPTGWRQHQRLIGAALFTLAAGWVDEGIQALLPTRYYDLRDVGFNAVAGVMALAALEVVRRAVGSSRA